MSFASWIVKFACRPEKEKIIFIALDKYEDISGFLRLLSLIIIMLYHITSFDTAALIVDSLSTNGDTNPPIVQRCFWCITIAGTTTAFLVYRNNEDELKGIHAFNVICALPITFMLCYNCTALWRLLKEEPS